MVERIRFVVKPEEGEQKKRCSSRIYIQIRPGSGPAAGANLLIFCFAPEHFSQTIFSLNLFIFLLFQTFCERRADDKENTMMTIMRRWMRRRWRRRRRCASVCEDSNLCGSAREIEEGGGTLWIAALISPPLFFNKNILLPKFTEMGNDRSMAQKWTSKSTFCMLAYIVDWWNFINVRFDDFWGVGLPWYETSFHF